MLDQFVGNNSWTVQCVVSRITHWRKCVPPYRSDFFVINSVSVFKFGNAYVNEQR